MLPYILLIKILKRIPETPVPLYREGVDQCVIMLVSMKQNVIHLARK